MRKRLFLLGLLAAAVTLAPGATIARAQAPIQHSLYQRYIDPFAASGWYPARTDMGVDWFVTRRLPVLAIGDAVILGSDSHNSGWPGGHFIWYQLLDGSHAGDVIYVAEHLTQLLPAGVHRPEDRGGAPGRHRHRVGLGRAGRRPPRPPLLPRGRGHPLGSGDGAFPEVSWGAGPGPAGSWSGCTARQPLLIERHPDRQPRARRLAIHI
jgi:hypothetical protein